VLAAATTANFGQFGTRAVLGPLVPAIITAYGRSTGEIGAVLSLQWVAFALTQYPSGALADTYGERRIVTVALGTAVVASALVAAAPSFPVFAAAAVLLGAGTGLYFSVGTALLDRLFDDTGTAFGVHSSGASISGLLLPPVATAALARFDWRAGVVVGTVAAGGALLLFRSVVDPLPPKRPEGAFDRLRPRAALAMLSDRRVAFATFLGAVGIYVFQSVVSFFPTFLQEYRGLAPGESSLAFSAVFLLIILGNPVAGRLADRSGTAVGIGLPMVVAAAGMAVLVVAPMPAALGGIVLVGLGTTWGGPIQSRVMGALGDEGGTGFAVSRGVYLLLGASGSAVTGGLADAAGWPAAIAVIVGLLAIAAGLLLVDRIVGPDDAPA
jgi:predicted MFS family arabinose efflux permease